MKKLSAFVLVAVAIVLVAAPKWIEAYRERQAVEAAKGMYCPATANWSEVAVDKVEGRYVVRGSLDGQKRMGAMMRMKIVAAVKDGVCVGWKVDEPATHQFDYVGVKP
jgi:hypothetical protein